MAQKTIDGTDVKLEIVKSEKKVYAGKFFTLTITEASTEALDKLAEKSIDNSHWIGCHMRIKEKLTIGHEGKCFQEDLEEFKKALK